MELQLWGTRKISVKIISSNELGAYTSITLGVNPYPDNLSLQQILKPHWLNPTNNVVEHLYLLFQQALPLDQHHNIFGFGIGANRAKF